MMTRLQIGEYSAWVTVDGEEQECYDVKTSQYGKTSECWIASQVGKEFKVHFTFAPKIVCVADLKLEGAHVLQTMLNFPAAVSQEMNRREAAVSHLWTSESTLQPLRFTQIELTDDDQFLHDSAREPGQRNTLQVDIRRANFIARQDLNDQDPARQSAFSYASVNGLLAENKKIHERTAKGLVHSVGLGSESIAPSPLLSWAMKYKTQRLESLATFTFRYTSREILRARRIIVSESTDEPHSLHGQVATLGSSKEPISKDLPCSSRSSTRDTLATVEGGTIRLETARPRSESEKMWIKKERELADDAEVSERAINEERLRRSLILKPSSSSIIASNSVNTLQDENRRLKERITELELQEENQILKSRLQQLERRQAIVSEPSPRPAERTLVRERGPDNSAPSKDPKRPRVETSSIESDSTREVIDLTLD